MERHSKFSKKNCVKKGRGHAKKIIENKYERVMLVAKENNNSFKPIKSKIEEERIEIAE